jgi:hypothetical protein
MWGERVTYRCFGANALIILILAKKVTYAKLRLFFIPGGYQENAFSNFF